MPALATRDRFSYWLGKRCARGYLWLAAVLLAGILGCKGSPFQPPPGQVSTTSNPLEQQAQSLATQVQELNRRVAQLDQNNADLHRQVAQTEQMRQSSLKKVELLQKELGQLGERYKGAQLAQQEAQKQVTALQASTRFRGGATLSANNSVQQSLQAVTIPGLDIRQDGTVIRIGLPADKLFTPGSAQLQPDGSRMLDEVASAITRSYARQRIVVEGHTDDTLAANPAAAHLLTSAQAQAVFAQLVERGRLPPRQLSILAMGSSYPLASNGTAAGQAKNRRVEIVVYPDSL
jgi:flagellar motor protein MotB